MSVVEGNVGHASLFRYADNGPSRLGHTLSDNASPNPESVLKTAKHSKTGIRQTCRREAWPDTCRRTRERTSNIPQGTRERGGQTGVRI